MKKSESLQPLPPAFMRLAVILRDIAHAEAAGKAIKDERGVGQR